MILSVTNICKQYKNNTNALKNISFSLQENRCLGVVGKNGAGKSTLLKILCGLIQKTSGRVSYFSREQLNNNIKKKIGFYLGQEYLPEEMTGVQYLEFIKQVYERPEAGKNDIQSLIDFFFGDKKNGDQLIENYSTGMRQKIGIAGSLISRPELLILDEPFSGLDTFSAIQLIDLLVDYKIGHSIIISSHDLNYLEKICTDLLIVDGGVVKYEGTIQDLTTNGSFSLEESLLKSVVGPAYTQQNLGWLF